MNLLLDTHALLWVLDDSPRLGSTARGLIAERINTVFVSIVSLWEIAVKMRVGKLEVDFGELVSVLPKTGFSILDLRLSHLSELITLPVFPDHRDPFDHLLIAQAKAEGLVILSADQVLRRYPVTFHGL